VQSCLLRLPTFQVAVSPQDIESSTTITESANLCRLIVINGLPGDLSDTMYQLYTNGNYDRVNIEQQIGDSLQTNHSNRVSI